MSEIVQLNPINVGCLTLGLPRGEMEVQTSSQLFIGMIGHLRILGCNLQQVVKHLGPIKDEEIQVPDKDKEGKVIIHKCTVQQFAIGVIEEVIRNKADIARAITVLLLLPEQMRALRRLLMAPGDKPVKKEVLNNMMGIEDAKASFEIVALRTLSVIDKATGLSATITKLSIKNEDCQALQENIATAKDEVAKAQTAYAEATTRCLDATYHFEVAEGYVKEYVALTKGVADYRTCLEQQKNEIKVQLKAAKQRCHDYTYRGWGPFAEMWSRDVTLAKEEVTHYKAALKTVREKLQAPGKISNISDRLVKAEANKLKTEKALVAAKAKALDAFNVLKARNEALKKAKKLFRDKLVDSNAINSNQLLRCMDAAESFNGMVTGNSVTGTSNSQAMKQYFATLVGFYDGLMDCTTRKAQLEFCNYITGNICEKGDPIQMLQRAEVGAISSRLSHKVRKDRLLAYTQPALKAIKAPQAFQEIKSSIARVVVVEDQVQSPIDVAAAAAPVPWQQTPDSDDSDNSDSPSSPATSTTTSTIISS